MAEIAGRFAHSNKKLAANAAGTEANPLQLPGLDIRTKRVEIVGDTPLVWCGDMAARTIPGLAFTSAFSDAFGAKHGGKKVPGFKASVHVSQKDVSVSGDFGVYSSRVRYMGQEFERSYPKVEVWSCILDVRFNATIVCEDVLMEAIDIAGFAIGIGMFRPARNGSYGTFHVCGVR